MNTPYKSYGKLNNVATKWWFHKTYLPSEPMSNASAGRSKSQGLLCDTLYSQHSPDKLPRANCSPLLRALGQNTFMICPPKVAHLVETVSLGSNSFQTGVTLGGAWWRAAFLLPMQSYWAENLHHGTGGRKILLARILSWLNPVAKAISLISR